MTSFHKLLLLIIMLFSVSCTLQNSRTFEFGSKPTLNSLVPTSDYVFYNDCATLPTLYGSLNMLTHNKPSFMYMGREGTIDTTKLPNYVTLLPLIKKTDENGKLVVDVQANDTQMRNKIAELNKANPNATFTFFMNDLRLSKVQNLFYSQGISPSRVRVVMLSDGTATYTSFFETFNTSDAQIKWNTKVNFIQGQMDRKDPLTNPNEFSYAWGTGRTARNSFWVGPNAESNIEFWIQWPNMLKTGNENLIEHLESTSSKYYQVQPFEIYDSFNQAQKDQFLAMVGLDKVWANGEGGGTLNNQTIEQAFDASPKPNIIITGTNPYSDEERNTDEYIKKVKAYYGDGYDYFFKGHPADMTQPADKSVTVLPFRLPMEAIMWAFNSKLAAIGGYSSTLYMSASSEVEKFYFPNEEFVTPLDVMYRQGLLGKVTFLK